MPKKKFIISVSRKNITYGYRVRATSCAIARAIDDKKSLSDVSVNGMQAKVTYKGKRYCAPLQKRVRNFIIKFDDSTTKRDTLKPFKFVLRLK